MPVVFDGNKAHEHESLADVKKHFTTESRTLFNKSVKDLGSGEERGVR